MKSSPRILLAVAALGAAVVWALGEGRAELLRPRLGIPSVLRPGEELGIELALSRPRLAGAVDARLEGPGGTVRLELTADRPGLVSRALRARVPEDAPPGAYALVVRRGDEELRRARAVWLRDAFPERMTIVQLADLPTFGHDGSGDRAFARILAEVDVVAPDLVLLTGDVAYGGSEDQYAALHAALETVDAPVVVALGNHEYEGLASYLEHFGAPFHAVDVGPLRIVSLNSAHGRDQLTASQAGFLHAALASRGERTAIVQLHHPPFRERRLGARVRRFVAEVAAAEVPIVLSGHWHYDAVFDQSGVERQDVVDFEGPKFVVTTAAGAELHGERTNLPTYHGYRVIRLAGGALERYTYDHDGDGAPDPGLSWPIGLLEVEHPAPGVALARNGWSEAIPAARLRLELEGDRRGLVADRGRVVAASFDGQRTRFELRVDLPARADTRVRLVEAQ